MMCCAVSLPTEETDLEVMTGPPYWHLQNVSFDMGKIFWGFFYDCITILKVLPV